MSAILEAARLQGDAQITRKATACCGAKKVHLWELSTGGVILVQHFQGEGFRQPVKLDEPMEVIVNRFRDARGHKVFTGHAI